jgi:hypothetical protein
MGFINLASYVLASVCIVLFIFPLIMKKAPIVADNAKTINSGIETLQNAFPVLETGGIGMMMDAIQIFCMSAEKYKDIAGKTPEETQSLRHDLVKELISNTYGTVRKEELTAEQNKILDSLIEVGVKMANLSKKALSEGSSKISPNPVSYPQSVATPVSIVFQNGSPDQTTVVQKTVGTN